MSRMSQLHMIITDAIACDLSEDLIIDLMVEEGLPREACPEILRVFKQVESVNEFSHFDLYNRTNFTLATFIFELVKKYLV